MGVLDVVGLEAALGHQLLDLLVGVAEGDGAAGLRLGLVEAGVDHDVLPAVAGIEHQAELAVRLAISLRASRITAAGSGVWWITPKE